MARRRLLGLSTLFEVLVLREQLERVRLGRLDLGERAGGADDGEAGGIVVLPRTKGSLIKAMGLKMELNIKLKMEGKETGQELLCRIVRHPRVASRMAQPFHLVKLGGREGGEVAWTPARRPRRGRVAGALAALEDVQRAPRFYWPD